MPAKVNGFLQRIDNKSIHLNLSRQDDGNDEPVDGNCLTEDDRDQVLGFDPWGLHASADNAEKFN